MRTEYGVGMPGAFFAKKIHLDLFKAFGFSQIYDEFKAVLHLIVITDPFRRFAGKRTAVNTVRELPAVIRVAAGGCPRAGIRASGGKVYAVARVRVHHGRRLGRIGFGAHVDLIHADVMDGAVGDLGRRDIKFIAQIPRCDQARPPGRPIRGGGPTRQPAPHCRRWQAGYNPYRFQRRRA